MDTSASTPQLPGTRIPAWIWMAASAAVASVLALSLCCIGAWWFWGGPAARFDPSDIGATERWAANEQRRIQALRGNEIALTDAIAAFERENAKHVGKKVQWRMQVVSVSKDFVTLHPWFGAIPGHTPMTLGVFTGGLKVGDAISREKAAMLQPDGHVAVTGNIKSVSFGKIGFCPTFELENAKAE